MSSDPLQLPTFKKVEGAELKQLQKLCMQLMQQDDEPSKFPGAQPVSFERRHISAPKAGHGMHPSLVAQPYFAAEKTDGVRYMLLILGARGTFCVDRNFDMRRLPPMKFPSRVDPSAPLDKTLLDGELIADVGGTGQPLPDAGSSDAAPSAKRLRFLAYDACRVAGKACCDEPLHTRLMALRREVLSPRYKLSMTEPSSFDGEPFTVELKDFFELGHLPHIFKHVNAMPHNAEGLLYAFEDPLRKLSHGNDGIIFTPMVEPYRPYTCPSLLKWKPANMNSVDFQLQRKFRKQEGFATPQPRFFLCVATQGIIEPFSWITFNESDFSRFATDPNADSRIIECVFDPSWHTVEYNPDDFDEKTWDNPRTVPGGWRFERIREDKKLPNDKRTVSSIHASVRDGVTAPELLHALGIRADASVLQGAFAPQQGQPQQHMPPPSIS